MMIRLWLSQLELDILLILCWKDLDLVIFFKMDIWGGKPGVNPNNPIALSVGLEKESPNGWIRRPD